MRLKPEERTSSVQLQVRVLRRLAAARNGELLATSELGLAAWPSNNLRAQGLAFAIGPTLAILRKQGLVGWAVQDIGKAKFWGWVLTRKGQEMAKSL